MNIPLYRRNELPSSQVGLVKPPIQLAEQGGGEKLGQAVSGIAETLLGRIISAQEDTDLTNGTVAMQNKYQEYEKWQNDHPEMAIDEAQNQTEFKARFNDQTKEELLGSAKTLGGKQQLTLHWKRAVSVYSGRAQDSAMASAARQQEDSLNAFVNTQAEIGTVTSLQLGSEAIDKFKGYTDAQKTWKKLQLKKAIDAKMEVSSIDSIYQNAISLHNETGMSYTDIMADPAFTSLPVKQQKEIGSMLSAQAAIAANKARGTIARVFIDEKATLQDKEQAFADNQKDLDAVDVGVLGNALEQERKAQQQINEERDPAMRQFVTQVLSVKDSDGIDKLYCDIDASQLTEKQKTKLQTALLNEQVKLQDNKNQYDAFVKGEGVIDEIVEGKITTIEEARNKLSKLVGELPPDLMRTFDVAAQKALDPVFAFRTPIGRNYISALSSAAAKGEFGNIKDPATQLKILKAKNEGAEFLKVERTADEVEKFFAAQMTSATNAKISAPIDLTPDERQKRSNLLRSSKPVVTDYGIVNGFQNQIIDAADGTPEEKTAIRAEIWKAKNVEGKINQQQYDNLTRMAQKDYPLPIVMGLRSVFNDIGVAPAKYRTAGAYNNYVPFLPEINVPMADEFTNQQKVKFVNAITQWIDARPDINKITLEDIHKQAILLGGEFSGDTVQALRLTQNNQETDLTRLARKQELLDRAKNMDEPGQRQIYEIMKQEGLL